MRLRTLVLGCGALVGLVALAFAPNGGAMAESVDCAKAMNTVEMNFCAERDLNAADARLNAVYKKLISKQDQTAKSLLVDAQRKWIAFRDAACAFEGDMARGGTIQGLLGTTCLARLTKTRADDLEAAIIE